MKIHSYDDIVFSDTGKLDYIDGGKTFAWRCVFNFSSFDGLSPKDYKVILDRIIEESSDVEDLIDRYLACDDLRNQQAYAVLSERFRPEGHWIRIRKNLGARVFKTMSDAGGVRVGNDSFSIVIGNGRGDGVTRVAVLKKGEWNDSFLNFKEMISGNEINIYDYDCGGSVAVTLEPSRYGVYTGNGFVVFEQWD